ADRCAEASKQGRDPLQDAERLHPAEPAARYHPGTNKYRERVTTRVRAHALEPYAPVDREERGRGRRSHGHPDAAARVTLEAESRRSLRAPHPAVRIDLWPIAKPIPYAGNARKIPQAANRGS